MKKIVCEMCGSNDLLKKDGVFECQSCGTKYTVEEAKKMMVDGVVNVEGTVKIDDSNKIDNLVKNGKTLYQDGKFDEAYSLFGEVLNIDPDNYISIAYKGLCSAWKSSIKEPLIADAVTGLSRSLEIVNKKLGKSKELSDFAFEISSKIFEICKANINLYLNYYKENFEHFKKESKVYLDAMKSENLENLAAAFSGRYVSYSNSNYYSKRFDKLKDNYDIATENSTAGLKLTFTTLSVVSIKVLAAIENFATIKQYKSIKKDLDECIDGVNGYVFEAFDKEYCDVTACSKTCDKVIKEISQKKKEEYLKNHKEEKQEVDSCEAEIKANIQMLLQLKKDKEEILQKIDPSSSSSKKMLKDLTDKKGKLEEEKDLIGLFKLKEKKLLQEQIDDLDEQIEKLSKDIQKEKENLTEKYQNDIKKIDSQIENVENKIEKLKSKVLEKEREIIEKLD